MQTRKRNKQLCADIFVIHDAAQLWREHVIPLTCSNEVYDDAEQPLIYRISL